MTEIFTSTTDAEAKLRQTTITSVEDRLATIAEALPDETTSLLAKLRQRVGEDTFRNSFFEVIERNLGANTERPKFLRVGEFLRFVGDPPPMLVDRLLPEKTLILVSGKPKAGKSFLALDIGNALAEGKMIVGEFAPSRSGPVAYLGMEDGQYEIANRMLKRGDRKDTDRLFYICPDRFLLSTAEGIATLDAMLKEVEQDAGTAPLLCIIDTARESLGIKDWNDPAEVGDKLRPLREYARTHCTVLLVAHNRKAVADQSNANGDEIAGSNALTSSVDGWISAYEVEKRDNGDRRLHLSIMGRGNMNDDFWVEMDTNTLHFRYVPDDEVKGEQTVASARAAEQRSIPLLNVIYNRLGGQAIIEEAASAMGMEYDTCRLLMNDAEKNGFLIRTKDKAAKSGPGRSSYYFKVVVDNLPPAVLEAKNTDTALPYQESAYFGNSAAETNHVQVEQSRALSEAIEV